MFASAFMLALLAVGTRWLGMEWPPFLGGAGMFLVALVGGLVLTYKIEMARRRRPDKRRF